MFFLRLSKSGSFLVIFGFLCVSLLGRHFFIQPFSLFTAHSNSKITHIISPDCDFRVIGHRGNSYTAPEDTAVSIDEAFQFGANMVEVDVRLSREGTPVLMHDSLLDRTSNGSGPVSNWSLDMLKTLDAGSWKDPQYKHVKVPSLAEAIQSAAGRGPLYLDIKVADLHKPIAKVLKENNFPPNSVYPAVTSLLMLKQYHEALPGTPLIWFRNIPQDWDASWLDSLIEQGVVGLELSWSDFQGLEKQALKKQEPMKQGLEKENLLLKMARAKGLEIWTYTLNGKQELQQAVKAKVNGIETDRPHVLHDIACAGGHENEAPLNRIVGFWDFSQANLQARLGSNLRHWGLLPDESQKIKIALASEFKLPFPGNKDKKILFVPAFSPQQAIQLSPGLHHFGPGSGHRVNRYSLLLDLLRPTESSGKKQALLQTSWNNKNLAEIYINENGSLGNEENAVGFFEVNVWQRLVIVVDLLTGDQGKVKVFLDGVLQGILPGDGVDGHYSVRSNINNKPLLLFSDVKGNSAVLFVSKIQLRDYAMSDEEVKALGDVTRELHL